MSLAENVAARLAQPSKPPNEKWSQESQSGFHETLSADQGKAVERAMTAPMLILTGGPGTGKTYTLRTIVALWRSMGKTVQCCAPTVSALQSMLCFRLCFFACGLDCQLLAEFQSLVGSIM